jgi:hypothetical protein
LDFVLRARAYTVFAEIPRAVFRGKVGYSAEEFLNTRSQGASTVWEGNELSPVWRSNESCWRGTSLRARFLLSTRPFSENSQAMLKSIASTARSIQVFLIIEYEILDNGHARPGTKPALRCRAGPSMLVAILEGNGGETSQKRSRHFENSKLNR